MKRVYFDNGATSFPKPESVAKAMSDYILYNGSNIGRAAYKNTLNASRVVYETRKLLCELFHFNYPDHVVFTKNITESMNVCLKGLLKEEDHIITSSMEHNSVIRPIHSIGCQKSIVKADKYGYVHLEDIKKEIKPSTKAVVLIHGSNVTGAVNDIKEIGTYLKSKNILFIVDSAQTAGVIDISMDYIDILCFTGHKGLLGPSGIGGFLIQPDTVKKVKPFIEGGTGSKSDLEYQPTIMPDKYESGTQNIVGIYGLNAALHYIKEKGIKHIYQEEMKLVDYFFKHYPFDNIIGLKDTKNRTAVISLDFKEKSSEISFELSSIYHIEHRVGLHCSYLAHQTVGTYPNGTLRISFSHFNTISEVDYFMKSIIKIINE